VVNGYPVRRVTQDEEEALLESLHLRARLKLNFDGLHIAAADCGVCGDTGTRGSDKPLHVWIHYHERHAEENSL
jgi:hypothetical protein